MHLHDILRSEIEARFGTNLLNIVETGTIRGTSEPSRVGDGWSTQFFAQWPYLNHLDAIDLNTKTVPLVLTTSEMRSVRLHEGHSISKLSFMLVSGGHDYDIAFLDSDNDAQLILHEFLIAEHLVDADGLIIIDDVRMPEHPEGAKKGDLVWPWIKEHGYKWHIREREGWAGYKTGVLVIEPKIS